MLYGGGGSAQQSGGTDLVGGVEEDEVSVELCTTHDRPRLVVQDPPSGSVTYDVTGSGVVARISGHVVGAAAYGGPGAGAHELTVEVAPAWRRLGIGSGLLSRALALAVAAGHAEVVLVAPVDDEGFVPLVCGAGLRARLKASDGVLHARILLPGVAA